MANAHPDNSAFVVAEQSIVFVWHIIGFSAVACDVCQLAVFDGVFAAFA